jgi:hypothetical protein
VLTKVLTKTVQTTSSGLVKCLFCVVRPERFELPTY